MVATRRGAKKAPEAAPAPSNTLNAPPKRGGRRTAVVEEAAESAPAVTKTTKTSAARRKAKSEPEAAEPPMAKKPAANSKATRAAKVETTAEPAPTVAKRATRGRKTQEPATLEEPAVIEEAPKPAATRGRKATTKKAPAPKIEEPAIVEEAVAEEAPKPASRARKVPARKAPVSKKVELPVIEETAAVELVKPAPRGRKAAAPKLSAPAPVITSRATRGRNFAVPPQDSPLKAPARKPTKKAAAVAVAEAKADSEPVEGPFAQYPGYPTTPAHIAAPMTAGQAMRELPQYPDTPAHILAPISTKDALSIMPGYPKTPSHIVAPMTSKAALAEMPGYPKTPAHIKAPISVQDAMAEMPDYPQTPAHIVAQAAASNENVMDELPDYPKTPAHITAPITNAEAMKELPGYPKTPAHIIVSVHATENVNEHPMTPERITPPHSKNIDGDVARSAPTPYQNTPPAAKVAHEFSEASEMPTSISWGVADQEAFEELPAAYPTTPAHIAAPVTTREALAELPGYPKTPAHITAPITPRRAFAELPDYPTTPAIAIEAAIQEEITASINKQTPSPLQFPTLADVSFQFADTSEYTDVDPMEIDSEAPAPELAPKMHLAPLQLTANLPVPELASPKKSALRSPQKIDTKTPKKAVTWDDPEESELFMYDGPLQGMTFYVDVTSNGKDQNYLFSSLLEDLGAKVVKDLTATGLSHVLYKDGNKSTLEKVLGSKGAIKCVNVGWVLDSEKNKMRMDEAPYLVDLSIAMPTSPLPTTTLKPFTPARTPSRYALPPSSECKSVPTTPTSSEFDRSVNFDEKENCEHGVYFDCLDVKQVRTVPQKKSTFLFSRTPIKTPSKPSFLMNTPMKPMSAIKPFSTSKKRSAESSFPGISMAPPKKLRLF